MVEEESNEGEAITIQNLIDGKEYEVPVKKIYPKHPHITADNHFSGENVMPFLGESGFGMIFDLPP